MKMIKSMGFLISSIVVLSIFFPWFSSSAAHQIRHPPAKVFPVKWYGAVADGKTDNTNAFSETWDEACNWRGNSVIYIPEGIYVVDSILFLGPCKGGSTWFLLNGVLKPPKYTKSSDYWINFRYVDRLRISGRGTIDGEGFKVWDQSKNRKNGANGLPVSVSLAFVTNSRIDQITSLNSRNAHFSLFACRNLGFTHVKIIAPRDSPNTDGIKIGESTGIRIWSTGIATGDDCVAIISGSKDIDVWDVRCGPGHGISVGSLGQFGGQEDVVTGVTVRDSVFVGTGNGVRIKTWGSSWSGMASNLTYRNIKMIGVDNPIVIDQQYCPYPPCSQTPSHIQVKDVTYKHIWGTSATKVAVAFNCSRRFPCRNVVMENIHLAYAQGGGPATSLCSNVIGSHSGVQTPPACL